jgi:lipopolysaccharide/colanic/teichoic acid biosynthesis glycosyltransferase
MVTLQHSEAIANREHVISQPGVARTGPGPLYLLCKRIIDVVVAGLLLLVLAPFLLVIAVLIKLDSPGPVIFSQKRYGARVRLSLNRGAVVEHCTFTFYKFRTMYANASSERHRDFIAAYIRNDASAMAALQNGPVSEASKYKMNGDPRVTRIGRLLRRTSLDELPQFWNVLIGDMTLVGPRPPLPYEVEMYEPRHRRRLDAKPGITGLWQVKGRSSTTFDEMVRLDVEYITNQSLWTDIKILLATPAAVVAGKGAK